MDSGWGLIRPPLSPGGCNVFVHDWMMMVLGSGLALEMARAQLCMIPRLLGPLEAARR